MTGIGVVKARLVELLAAAVPDARVLPGPVSATTVEARVVEVGGPRTPVQYLVTALDGSSGTATYTLMITCSVSLPGSDGALAEDMAVADFVAAVDAIQADETLGLDAVSATVDGSGELFESATQQGRSAAMQFPVVIFTTL